MSACSHRCLPHTAFLLLLGQRAPLCLSWVSKYNRHGETEAALSRHTRLTPAAAALRNPPGKSKSGAWGKGRAIYVGQRVQKAAGCVQPSAPHENLWVEKQKDLNHGRRCGKYEVPSRVLSNTVVGMGERVFEWGRVGFPTHRSRESPQAQLEARRGTTPNQPC